MCQAVYHANMFHRHEVHNYQQVTRIFWNKRFAEIIEGLKYFVFIINNSSLRYVLTAWTLAYFEFVGTLIMSTEHISDCIRDALILWMCIGAGSVYWLGVSESPRQPAETPLI